MRPPGSCRQTADRLVTALSAPFPGFLSGIGRARPNRSGRVAVAVESTPTRDRLWLDMNRGNAGSHVALWTDMTKRAPDEVRAAPASMLGFASWLSGHGALAWCALDQVPRDKPYKLSDGGGLYLLVTTAGQRYWRMDYRFGEKRATAALGVYPTITLAEARAKRLEIKKQIAEGINCAPVRSPTAVTSSAGCG